MNYKFKTKPYAHQLKALEMSWNREVFAYFMEMGTGKSKVLLDNIAMLYDRGKINGALIIAPKGVYKNWFDSEIPVHMVETINKLMLTSKTKKKQRAQKATRRRPRRFWIGLKPVCSRVNTITPSKCTCKACSVIQRTWRHMTRCGDAGWCVHRTAVRKQA